ncbi:MAG: iron-sulfur cluster assembly scaffold protein [Steroidobacteraceae bacterium]
MTPVFDAPLPPEVAALFRAPRHAGAPQPGAAIGIAGSPALGTQVEFSLRSVSGRVRDLSFRAYGCPYTLAACEWLAIRLQGVELAAGLPEGPLQWAAALQVPDQRLGRLLVLEDALRAAWNSAMQHEHQQI